MTLSYTDAARINTHVLLSAVPPKALYVFYTHVEVDKFNYIKLQSLKTPIVTCWTRHLLSVANMANHLESQQIQK